MEIMKEEINELRKSGDLKDYFELVKIPSVGADPVHLKDCVATAMWWKRWLGAIGAEAQLVLPPTHPIPVVFATIPGGEGAPTLLVYGHYDVQPVEPLDAWKTPPFEPTEIDGRVYARGAQDDKGQSFAFLCGVRDALAAFPAGKRPAVKIVLEGQEESGSAGLSELLATAEFRRRVGADALLVCDTSAATELRPAIVAGLRGVAHLTVRLTGPNRDLHSGEYGGVAPNPAQAIAELVASLHNADGSIAVAGFADGILPPSPQELALAEAGAPTDDQYRADIGCEPCGGEAALPAVRRNSFEPTIEVNGIHSGYGGAGSKTVIPSEAIAKLSMRLVPGQNAAQATAALKAHLEAHVPRGMTLVLEDVNEGAGGFRLPIDSPVFRLAQDELARMDARGPVFQWDGASIPVVSLLKDASGAAPLIVGWGQAEDRIHSPNESYSLEQFALAKEWGRRIVAAFAE